MLREKENVKFYKVRERFSNYKGFVKGEGFPGPGNIEVHYNSIGFGKGKGKRKLLQSTPGPGIHYNSIGFGKGRATFTPCGDTVFLRIPGRTPLVWAPPQINFTTSGVNSFFTRRSARF